MNPFKIVSRLRNNVEYFKKELSIANDLVLGDNTRQMQLVHPNPLNAFGRKCFSQTDEDGITIEILRRLEKLKDGVYAEYGVGDGMENNTLILAALGWRGFWVGGQKLRPNISTGRGNKFQYAKCWITLENILQISEQCLSKIERHAIDVVSLDLDGNDIHFLRQLLLEFSFRPKLFIVEYNAKFAPPIEFEIAYDPQHVWRGDDYFGASLTSLERLFGSHNYRLVCCNTHTGANAFFVDCQYSDMFDDVPTEIGRIFVGPRYALYKQYGHKSSIKTIERIFNTL